MDEISPSQALRQPLKSILGPWIKVQQRGRRVVWEIAKQSQRGFGSLDVIVEYLLLTLTFVERTQKGSGIGDEPQTDTRRESINGARARQLDPAPLRLHQRLNAPDHQIEAGTSLNSI